ncbi:MAG TPA: type II toxin-antitoxin system VapC family toxin [Solirubrobacterales bacterium]|nr:type II toxin-antitoxin system VapC family toxin [Solirubrobacterales bacterium]
MPVIDASVVVTVLTDAEHAPWAEAQLSSAGADRSLWVPHLIDAEVGQALRRAVTLGRSREGRAEAALLDLMRMPLRRIDHVGLLHRAWELRHNFSFYDGLYVALAEGLDVPLVTLDRRLARAVGDATEVAVLIPV